MGIRWANGRLPGALGRGLRLAVLALGCVAVTVTGAIASAAPPDSLIMFVQAGCPYCAAWDRDVGKVYPKTDEAKVLPVRRVDIHTTRPRDLQALGGVVFTPTFVIMHCGREFRRLTGYTGQDNFWGLLDEGVKAISTSPPC